MGHGGLWSWMKRTGLAEALSLLRTMIFGEDVTRPMTSVLAIVDVSIFFFIAVHSVTPRGWWERRDDEVTRLTTTLEQSMDAIATRTKALIEAEIDALRDASPGSLIVPVYVTGDIVRSAAKIYRTASDAKLARLCEVLGSRSGGDRWRSFMKKVLRAVLPLSRSFRAAVMKQVGTASEAGLLVNADTDSFGVAHDLSSAVVLIDEMINNGETRAAGTRITPPITVHSDGDADAVIKSLVAGFAPGPGSDGAVRRGVGVVVVSTDSDMCLVLGRSTPSSNLALLSGYAVGTSTRGFTVVDHMIHARHDREGGIPAGGDLGRDAAVAAVEAHVFSLFIASAYSSRRSDYHGTYAGPFARPPLAGLMEDMRDSAAAVCTELSPLLLAAQHAEAVAAKAAANAAAAVEEAGDADADADAASCAVDALVAASTAAEAAAARAYDIAWEALGGSLSRAVDCVVAFHADPRRGKRVLTPNQVAEFRAATITTLLSYLPLGERVEYMPVRLHHDGCVSVFRDDDVPVVRAGLVGLRPAVDATRPQSIRADARALVEKSRIVQRERKDLADRKAREKGSAAQATPLSHQTSTRVPLGLGPFAPLLNFDAVQSAPGPTAAAAAAVEGPKARFPPPIATPVAKVAKEATAASSGQGAVPGAAGSGGAPRAHGRPRHRRQLTKARRRLDEAKQLAEAYLGPREAPVMIAACDAAAAEIEAITNPSRGAIGDAAQKAHLALESARRLARRVSTRSSERTAAESLYSSATTGGEGANRDLLERVRGASLDFLEYVKGLSRARGPNEGKDGPAAADEGDFEFCLESTRPVPHGGDVPAAVLHECDNAVRARRLYTSAAYSVVNDLCGAVSGEGLAPDPNGGITRRSARTIRVVPPQPQPVPAAGVTAPAAPAAGPSVAGRLEEQLHHLSLYVTALPGGSEASEALTLLANDVYFGVSGTVTVPGRSVRDVFQARTAAAAAAAASGGETDDHNAAMWTSVDAALHAIENNGNAGNILRNLVASTVRPGLWSGFRSAVGAVATVLIAGVITSSSFRAAVIGIDEKPVSVADLRSVIPRVRAGVLSQLFGNAGSTAKGPYNYDDAHGDDTDEEDREAAEDDYGTDDDEFDDIDDDNETDDDEYNTEDDDDDEATPATGPRRQKIERAKRLAKVAEVAQRAVSQSQLLRLLGDAVRSAGGDHSSVSEGYQESHVRTVVRFVDWCDHGGLRGLVNSSDFSDTGSGSDGGHGRASATRLRSVLPGKVYKRLIRKVSKYEKRGLDGRFSADAGDPTKHSIFMPSGAIREGAFPEGSEVRKRTSAASASRTTDHIAASLQLDVILGFDNAGAEGQHAVGVGNGVSAGTGGPDERRRDARSPFASRSKATSSWSRKTVATVTSLAKEVFVDWTVDAGGQALESATSEVPAKRRRPNSGNAHIAGGTCAGRNRLEAGLASLASLPKVDFDEKVRHRLRAALGTRLFSRGSYSRPQGGDKSLVHVYGYRLIEGRLERGRAITPGGATALAFADWLLSTAEGNGNPLRPPRWALSTRGTFGKATKEAILTMSVNERERLLARCPVISIDLGDVNVVGAQGLDVRQLVRDVVGRAETTTATSHGHLLVRSRHLRHLTDHQRRARQGAERARAKALARDNGTTTKPTPGRVESEATVGAVADGNSNGRLGAPVASARDKPVDNNANDTPTPPPAGPAPAVVEAHDAVSDRRIRHLGLRRFLGYAERRIRKLVNKVREGTKGELCGPPLLLIGAGKESSQATTPAAAVARHLGSIFPYLMVSEYGSTGTCPHCLAEMTSVAAEGSSRSKRCSNPECPGSGEIFTWTSRGGEHRWVSKTMPLAVNRDVSAPWLIAVIGICELLGRAPPEPCRPKGLREAMRKAQRRATTSDPRISGASADCATPPGSTGPSSATATSATATSDTSPSPDGDTVPSQNIRRLAAEHATSDRNDAE